LATRIWKKSTLRNPEMGGPALLAEGEGRGSIVMDVHEPREIREALTRYGAKVQIRPLPVGDYHVGDSVGIERKTVSDFMSSMYSGRLGSQISSMAKCYDNPLLLVEGRPELQRIRFNIKSYYGYMCSLLLSKVISVIQTPNAQTSALVIHLIARRTSRPRRTPRGVRTRVVKSDDEAIANILSSFPGIGPVLSLRLLRRFGSIRDLLSATESEISCVEGVGKRKARTILRLCEHRVAL